MVIPSDIDKLAKEIALDFNKTIRERVDELLKIDCDMYTNLGIDSTDEERIKVWRLKSSNRKSTNLTE